jgi:hypothetical protein
LKQEVQMAKAEAMSLVDSTLLQHAKHLPDVALSALVDAPSTFTRSHLSADLATTHSTIVRPFKVVCTAMCLSSFAQCLQAELKQEVQMAKAEAMSAFGNDTHSL